MKHKEKEKEIRASGEIRAMDTSESSRTVTGYAAKFNTRSEFMGFYEIIKPGAFKNAIGKSDVRALVNHDPNLILARTASGTLKLEEDAIGLRYTFEVPNTTYGNDFLESVKRGDISQSSFAFSVKKEGQKWDLEKVDDKRVDIREITEVDNLYDVSPVTYPAYIDTSIAMRSKAESAATDPEDSDSDDDFLKMRLRFIEYCMQHNQ